MATEDVQLTIMLNVTRYELIWRKNFTAWDWENCLGWAPKTNLTDV